MDVGRPAPSPGELFAGRFTLLEQLGAGGMGVVYRVRDQHGGGEVALKTMARDDPEVLARFKDEFRAASDLRHPNLVRLGELIELDGELCFTMELIDGIDLVSWLRSHRNRLRATLSQLAAGLGALHAAGRVHRDLKPSNVLVGRDDRVVILDFGLSARVVDGRQLSDVIAVGTAAYVAPEQAAAQPVGPPADWYSVGVMLFEVLTGGLPFDGDALEVIVAKLDRAAPAVGSCVIGVPDDLAALCDELLRREPARRPDGAQVQRRLVGELAGTADPDRPRGGPARVHVGRQPELAAIRAGFEDSRHAGVLQLIVAEAGLGKSALVTAAVASLASAQPELVVLAGRCHERESLAYKAFDGVVDTLARRLRDLEPAALEAVLPRHVALLGLMFPSLGRVARIGQAMMSVPPIADLREARLRGFDAFAELLGRFAARVRLVVTIDDFHRADRDSVDLLSHVVRAPDAPHALFLLTARPSPVLETLDDLAERRLLIRPRRLDLAPLAADEARALVDAALTRVRAEHGAADAARFVDEAEGHPRFLLELAMTGGDASASLDELLWRRISALPTVRRDILGLLVAAEGPLTLAELGAALELTHGELLSDVDALREVELVTGTGRWPDSWIEPYHPRVAETIGRRAPPEVFASWHERLANGLDRERDPERVLSHWLAAGRSDDASALATAAAERATAALELHRAARLYRLALEHAPSPAQRGPLLAALAQVLADAGDSVRAADAYLAASAATDAPDRLGLQVRAADQLLLGGEIGRSMELLEEVLAVVGVTPAAGRAATLARLAWARLRLRVRLRSRPRVRPPSPDDRVRLDTFWSVAQGLSTLDTVRGAEFQARFLSLALEVDDDDLRCRGLALEAVYAAADGEPAKGRIAALLAEAGTLASRTGAPLSAGWVSLARAIASLVLGDFEVSRRAADDALETFTTRCVGAIWEQRSARVFGINARYFLGDVAGVADRTRRAVREADALRDRFTLAQLRGGIGNAIWLFDDDPAVAQDEAAAAHVDWPAPRFQLPGVFNLVAVVQAHLYADAGADAHRAVVETWPALERSLLLRIRFVATNVSFLRGRAAVAAGALDDARACAERLRKVGMTWGRPLARLLDAAIDVRRGRAGAAVAPLRAAVDELTALGMTMHAAAARRGLATLTEAATWTEPAAADAQALRASGVLRPERWLAMLAPGLSR